MKNIFIESNIKKTKNREMVLKVIQKANLPISAEEIYKTSVKNNNINLSTIYRTLNTLVNNDILIKQVRQDGVAYYQLNSHDHKHLLVCNICNKKVPLDTCPLEKVLKKVAEDTNFTITSHSIELYGICEKCMNDN